MRDSGKITKASYLGTIASFIFLLMLSVWLPGCNFAQKQAAQQIRLSSDYKAVFLDNGQIFFGKLDEQGESYLVLSDVFYVQNQVLQDPQDPTKKEVKNILVKRGNEWHGPDQMYVERNHIVVIEPVSANSRVSQLIKEAKSKMSDSQ
jgi:hypothetical protein